jgi:methionyl-tRNA formyltransferase
MRILFFTQSSWSIASISQLMQKHQIVGIITKKDGPKSNVQLLDFANVNQIEVLEWDKKNGEELGIWIKKEKIEIGLSFGFSYKIPKAIFDSFDHGVVNIHFGKLPTYAGPDPLFWTIKNQEKLVTLTFHKIDENWDAGELLSESSIPIFPGEPYGLLASRVSITAAQRLTDFLDNPSGHESKKLEQNSSPFSKPTEMEITIDWKTQKADEIEALVNAANPSYGGAITIFRETQVRILEVSPASVDIPGIFGPGSIVYSDPNYGIFILCGDFQYLRINILQLDGTIVSGQKIAAMGVNPHEKLG